ncbi:DNA-binding MarR family transcriptional regulator [Evansella vedderi]|uniref:DNA-binding MarR family transcriptional regulator n=1 Tax=Evansella vedderi TaxID=38282 RepID=A0ABU0A0P2_9BACI|nr:MarR family transcriptional regulator [Evansella vedderi]MDQ0256805.1 DNA-binding MarR family transcriptional regulator [Evansella vedderi]
MERDNIMKELEDILLDINLLLRNKLGNQVTAEFEEKLFTLSPNQQTLLFLVGEKGIKHVKDLSSFLNVSASAISQMVAKLEGMGILKRTIDVQNRRSTIIEVGPKGEELLAEMNKIKSTIFSKYLSKMEEQDLIAFKDSLTKFFHIIVTESKEDPE